MNVCVFGNDFVGCCRKNGERPVLTNSPWLEQTKFCSECVCDKRLNEKPENDRSKAGAYLKHNRLKRTKSLKSTTAFTEINPANDLETHEFCGYSGDQHRETVTTSVKVEENPARYLISSDQGPGRTNSYRDSVARTAAAQPSRTISGEIKPPAQQSGKELSSDVCHTLVEELQKLNPQFPVQRFFSLLLKKRNLSEEERSESCALKTEENERRLHPLASCSQMKRKQEVEGNESDAAFKRHRKCMGMSSVNKQESDQFSKIRNRLSKTKRKQHQTPFCALVTVPVQTDSVRQNQLHSSTHNDDLLWTERYQPQAATEVVGNSTSVQQLHSWLKQWKVRADVEERRRRQEEQRIKRQSVNEVDLWDCGDFEGDAPSMDQENNLCNTVLMIGPSGVGKTAAVYACAHELGFKVFEVNSSVLRCGRLLISQLTEATQSHQVHVQGNKGFKSLKMNSKVQAASPYAQRKVASSSIEISVSPCAYHSGQKPQTVKLTQFFKLSSKDSLNKTSDPERWIQAGKPESGFEYKKQEKTTSKATSSGEQNGTIPTSLLLFEEVDVIFPEDVGFLSAIKMFMRTTKRPIILTTNDRSFGARLGGSFEEIHFQTPSLHTARSFLQCLCVVENTRTDPEDMVLLLCQNKGDLRQSFLQLQFWIRSGGGGTELQILKDKLRVRHVFTIIWCVDHGTSRKTADVWRSWRRNNSEVYCTQVSFLHISYFDPPVCKIPNLQALTLNRTGLCKQEPFDWIGATLKDGLLDLPREEEFEPFFEVSLQIMAFVEVWGFHQCRTELCRIWREAVKLKKFSAEKWKQMFPFLSQLSDIKDLRLCTCNICQSRSTQKRREIISVLISSKKTCCSNKRALSMDYLPFLRSICRSEKKKQHPLRRSHYLSSLDLPRSTLDFMALDFT